jgi:hypothetical protein
MDEIKPGACSGRQTQVQVKEEASSFRVRRCISPGLSRQNRGAVFKNAEVLKDRGEGIPHTM